MSELSDAAERLQNFALNCEMSDLPVLSSVPVRRQTVADLHLILTALKDARSPNKARLTIPPNPADVTAYSASIGYPMIGDAWCDHYAVKGWAVGSTKMKDWQAAVRLWKTNRWGQSGIVMAAPTGEHRPRVSSTF